VVILFIEQIDLVYTGIVTNPTYSGLTSIYERHKQDSQEWWHFTGKSTMWKLKLSWL